MGARVMGLGVRVRFGLGVGFGFGLGFGLGFGEAAGVEAPAFTGLSDDTAGKLRAAAEELLRVTEPNVGDGGEAAEGAEDWKSCAAGKGWPLLAGLLRPQDVPTQPGTCFAPKNPRTGYDYGTKAHIHIYIYIYTHTR